MGDRSAFVGLDVHKRLRKRAEGQALKLMAQEPNLIRRPLVVVGRELIAGLDRDRLKHVLR